jgi:hypothetical protein
MNAALKQHQAFQRRQGSAVAVVIALAAAAAFPAGAAAQATLTLHGGWRMSSGLETAATAQAPAREVKVGDSNFGMVVAGWNLDVQRDLELQISQQRTTLSAPTSTGSLRVPLKLLTVQVGGINFFQDTAGAGPYVAGGVGMTRMTPDLEGGSSETRPSLAVALGYGWQFKTLTLRTEARFNTIVVNSSGGLFCSGGCALVVTGNTLTQLEASVGLGFRF